MTLKNWNWRALGLGVVLCAAGIVPSLESALINADELPATQQSALDRMGDTDEMANDAGPSKAQSEAQAQKAPKFNHSVSPG